MHRTNLSLDEEIAEVEARLAQRRAQLRSLVAEARSHVRTRNVVPVAMAAALAMGFAASRLTRRSAASAAPRRPGRPARMLGALGAALLPALVRPLQNAVAQWLAQRMHRSQAPDHPSV